MFGSGDLDEGLQVGRRKAEERDAERRAKKLGMPYLDLVSVKVPTETKAMKLVPEEKAREALLVPIQVVGKKLVVAVFDPEKSEVKEIVEGLEKKGFDVQVVVGSLSGLKHEWSHYKYVSDEIKEISGRVEIDEGRLQEIREEVGSLDDVAGVIEGFRGSTSQVLEVILGGALALRSSDIHMEPREGSGMLRLRIDGLLHNAYEEFKAGVYKSLITRIKLLSSLKLNITDAPQDGRFTIGIKGNDIEIRTSIIPSEYGETVVMRVLDPTALKVDLEGLGWREDDLEIVRAEIAKPNGLILSTGPTGSGKTTTLYAFLRQVFKPEIKVITVEDPIEYHLEGISQTQVDPGAKYTFASGLRSIVRQDPDVILVGEIRDKETAEIALNAALTGHLVFSTLHTNDAVGAVPRLYDLGVKAQVLGAGLSLVIAQRLVRVLCGECKKEKKLSGSEKVKISKFLDGLPKRVDTGKFQSFKVSKSKSAKVSEFKVFEPGKCEKCNNLGFKGRTSIFELFLVDDKIEELIYEDPTEIDLEKLAREQGMVYIQEDGILKVLEGVTSFSEVERLTGPIEFLGQKK